MANKLKDWGHEEQSVVPLVRYRFPPEIISYAIWAYHRFFLSLRVVEDLLAERGIVGSDEAIRLWCQKLGAN